MRRSKSGGQQNEDRKKNRNSKLLRGLGSMFKIGSNSIERTKDTKVMTRKSMPSPETLTNSGKFHGIFRLVFIFKNVNIHLLINFTEFLYTVFFLNVNIF